MSIIPKDSIKVIAEMVGVTNLSDDVSSAMSPDVEYRMREIIQEAIKFMKHGKRTKLTSEDINNSLRLRNLETLYGYSSKEPLHFQRASKDLFYIDDKEVDFQDIIAKPLPKIPRDSSIGAHWLAIEGNQPPIPQNPQLAEIAKKKKSSTNAPSTPQAPPGTTKIKPLVKQVLSKELQLYYEKIVLMVKSHDEELILTVIESLRTDPGLHPLLPYFIQFISEEVTQNLQNLKILNYLMRMVKSILYSSYFHIEPYLHQLMPPILTCIVGKQLGAPNENHWSLRDFTANLLAIIIRRYNDAYGSLYPRVSKTLLKAFMDPQKPFSSHYGAIVGTTALGGKATKLIILANLNLYMRHLDSALKSGDLLKQEEAQKCHGALLRAVGVHLRNKINNGKNKKNTKTSKSEGKQDKSEEDVPMKEIQSKSEESSGLSKATKTDLNSTYQELFEIFGESLIPFVSNEPSIES